ncbi:MAG TPA: zinc-ribbon domain-containing protein, partial [Vicinamibacteria bacterium]|nr:zinc-ribbon domain-containing protein [Vicinamibacteria bacterium]
MQSQCPQCATRIQVDDAKVPDKPFKVRCPKCQATLSLPGRTAASAPAPAPAADAPEPPPPPEFPSAAAIARRERLEAGENDAIVALAGPAAQPIRQAIGRLGYEVDAVDDIEEGALLLEQGVYEMAVTSADLGGPGQ